MKRVSAIFIVGLIAAAALLAQEHQRRQFVKITNSAGWTIAVDSTGQQFIYDTERDEFVPEDEYVGGPDSQDVDQNRDYGPDEVILPPEIRCTDIYVGDITEIFSEVVVDIDERIEGSITCGRDVVIKGLVTGNVVSYRTVTVESTGEVRGDVIARSIVRDRGGRILGQRKEVPFPEGIGVPQVTTAFPSFSGIILTGFAIFICLITIALFPRQLKVITTVIERSVLKSFFWGILVWFSILPVFVLLLITIVGIPIAILVFPFVLIAAFLMAYVAATIYIGQRVCPYFNWQDKSTYIKSIVGVVFIAVAQIISGFFGLVGIKGLNVLFGVIYFIIAFVAITSGLGAVATSRFGTRPKTPGTGPEPGGLPPGPGTVPPVKPPPPPRSESLPPQVNVPPPPVPPPAPKSGDATDRDEHPSNK